MAGYWIKMRLDLWDDPRVVRLAAATKLTKATVCGALYRLWSLADQYTADGRLVHHTAETIDDSVGVPGFSEALRQVAWLVLESDAVVIPEFDKHNGQSAKRRAQEAERMRGVRKTFASDANRKRTRSEPEGEEEGDREEDPSTSDLDGAGSVLEEKRGAVLHLAERIGRVVPCRCSNDWPLVAKVALLTAGGRFSEDDLEQSLEAVRLKGRDNPAAYFHSCLTNKARDFGQNFRAMLAGIREIPDWLRKPGEKTNHEDT